MPTLPAAHFEQFVFLVILGTRENGFWKREEFT